MKITHLTGALSIGLSICAVCHPADSSPLLDALNSDNRQERVDALNGLAALAPESDVTVCRCVMTPSAHSSGFIHLTIQCKRFLNGWMKDS